MERPLGTDEAATFHAIFDIIVQQGVMALVQKEAERAQQTQAITREMNEQLLISTIRQHELTQAAQNAEEALRASEEFSRTVLESSPDCVKVLDADGRLLRMNSTGHCLLEIDDFAAFCGKDWATLWPTESRDSITGGIAAAKMGRTSRFQVFGPTLKGTPKWWDVMVAPVRDGEGRVTRIVSVSRDVTEARQAEEQLQRAKEAAEAANRAKDTFLAVLSHELRTPLTPVLMAVTAMESNPDLPIAFREDVKMILRNVAMESNLIDDLLDLSRVTTGKLRLRPSILNINDLLQQTSDICRPQIRERGISLYCNWLESGGELMGDPARLQQVFWNLLNNAAKFTPEGGHIHVTAENVNAGWVRVSVRDTGMGIPPEILPHIFEAFEQGEVRITRQFGGLGLGLAICKALVEQHCGSIRATSDGPGKGSTFVVELPALSREQAVRAEAQPLPAAPTATGSLRLMIVEDHADTATILARMLTARGHSVSTATTAAAALALAGEHRFDIVISDLGLPDMTGYELMKQLKAKHGIRGIAMSGYGMEDDIRKGEEAGFDDHIVKPVRFAQLEQSIRRVAAK